MRDLPSVFRANDQVKAYRRRGLKAGWEGAVFTEVHVPSRERRVDARISSSVRRQLAEIFRPSQPQLD